MPFIVDVEKSGDKEVEGAFKISAKNVNLWVRICNTGYGKRARITMSYLEDGVWKNTHQYGWTKSYAHSSRRNC